MEIVLRESLLVVLDLGLVLSTLVSIPWAHVLRVDAVIELFQSVQASCFGLDLVIVSLRHVADSLDGLQVFPEVVRVHRAAVRTKSALDLGFNSW